LYSARGAVGGEHQPGEERADERHRPAGELGQDRLDRLFHDPVERLDVEIGNGRERSHPARVRSRVAVVGALEVARRGEHDGVGAVAEGEDRYLGAFEKLLDEDVSAKALGEGKACAELLLRVTDDHALSRREPVRLEHARRSGRRQERGGGHAGRRHHLLREALRALDAAAAADGEHGDPGMTELVDAATTAPPGPTTTSSAPSECASRAGRRRRLPQQDGVARAAIPGSRAA
jgi:hypothetical protein